ncbi:uncharacterized protein LOC126896869 [Daktulosphaira vitifoliae]|uniref:uncharacterized protein LOC126896869 n=1 Tax=Daktulosphaira vitifoliae TaxID=58002 RepID=UPI0021A98E08|nr:uncharacterized protein LOC126896869 [Daktulosphaira vitifoliae]
MKLCSVIFLFFSVYSIHFCKANVSYKTYVINVLNHIRNEKTFESLQHIVIKDTAIVNPIDYWDFNKPVTDSSVALTLKFMIHLLNYRFGEILQVFQNKFLFAIENCQRSFDNQQFDNFVICVQQMYDTIKNSRTMFKSLYDAVEFLYNLDFKLIDPLINVPESTLEIFQVYKDFTESIASQMPPQFVDENQNPNYDIVYNVHITMTNFFNNIYVPTTSSLCLINYQYCGVFSENVPFDLLIVYGGVEKLNEFSIIYSDITLVCDDLNYLCTYAIEYIYKTLGFEKLLYENNNTIIPPLLNEKMCREKVIVLINNIIKYAKQEFQHIKIFSRKDGYISSESILQGEINNFKIYRIKQIQVSQLIRCRFTEIFQNYYITLNVLIKICSNNEVQNSSLFIDYLSQLYITIQKAHILFISMLPIVETFKNGSTSLFNPGPKWSLEFQIREYVNFIENLNNMMIANTENIYDVNGLPNYKSIFNYYTQIYNFWSTNVSINWLSFYERTSVYCELQSDFFKNPDIMTDHFLKSNPTGYQDIGEIFIPICNYFTKYVEIIIENDLMKISLE